MTKFTALLLALAMFAFNTYAAVNVNTATQEQLESLHGIGPAKARAIIDYRNKNGNFKNIGELDNVPGIGQGVLGKIKADVSVSGATTVKAETKKNEPEAKKADKDVAEKSHSKSDKAPAAKADKDVAPAASTKADKKAEAKESDEKSAKAEKKSKSKKADEEADKKSDEKSAKKYKNKKADDDADKKSDEKVDKKSKSKKSDSKADKKSETSDTKK